MSVACCPLWPAVRFISGRSSWRVAVCVLCLFLAILCICIARSPKKLLTSKGDYWIKQWLSSIASLFEIRGKNFAPKRSEFFPLRAIPYDMENHYYHIKWPPLNVTIFIIIVLNCGMGAVNAVGWSVVCNDGFFLAYLFVLFKFEWKWKLSHKNTWKWTRLFENDGKVHLA